MNCLRNQNGIALIVTLLALALITAMVVEFAYGVYTGTNNLYNWRDSQRLSLMAKSGINVIAKYMPDLLKDISYKSKNKIEMPVENPFEDFEGVITVRIEDENAKCNINRLVDDFKNKTDYYALFSRLLRILLLDEKIGDKIVDWVIKNSSAKIYHFFSVDELLLINGITKKDYDKLLPYITVFGDGRININRAEKPVLMCLADGINDYDAQKVIDFRKNTPFDNVGTITQFSGFGTVATNFITKEGSNISIKSTASSGGVKRIIETVLDTEREKIKYWKEY